MIKVLIADDEVHIVEGLRSTIDWNAHNCVVAGVAYDGQEAYELACSLEPDILITDITMPRMDGLKLVEKLSAKFFEMGFIVLTCHESFSFAHTAFRMGVCDYIIKETMTRDELYQSLEKTIRMLHQRREQAVHAVEEEDPVLSSVLQYINSHLNDRLTLSDAAEVAAMNTSYFSRYFKKHVGENFVDYLVRKRIEYAKEQLRCTSRSIDDIAFESGYSNISYFHTAFKKIVGVSPGVYRKEQKSDKK